jgi:DNA-directed RNA polymerase
LEAKRQELLNSDDPEKKKAGEEMVTPTSIWLANQDPKAMASFRLALLGETKEKSNERFDKMKEKILGAETEAINNEIEASGVEPADIDSDPLVASEAVEAANEDFDPLEAESSEADVAESEAEADEAETSPKKTQRSVSMQNTLHVWLPLNFPPVPKKGDWDVARLRESKYFFS